MGLLNRLFGRKKDLKKEIAQDAETISSVWADYLDTYSKKRDLARYYSSQPNSLERLQQIEDLISKELVDISAEQKTQEEILEDLKRLGSSEEREEIRELTPFFQQSVTASVQKLLKKLYAVLQTELNVINLIKKDPKIADLSATISLQSLITQTEAQILSHLDATHNKKKANVINKTIGGAVIRKPWEYEVKDNKKTYLLRYDPEEKIWAFKEGETIFYVLEISIDDRKIDRNEIKAAENFQGSRINYIRGHPGGFNWRKQSVYSTEIIKQVRKL